MGNKSTRFKILLFAQQNEDDTLKVLKKEQCHSYMKIDTREFNLLQYLCEKKI